MGRIQEKSIADVAKDEHAAMRAAQEAMKPVSVVRIKKPTKAEMEIQWKSKDPKALAYEIATFMGGKWPERPVRKVQLSLEGAPTDAEELFEVTKLNPTLLSEMSIKARPPHRTLSPRDSH